MKVGISNCRDGVVDSPSEDMGLKNTAGNAATQNDQDGLTSAIKIQEAAENNDETATRYLAGVRRTSSPVTMLVRMPQATVGRRRRDVWRADCCCISWKLYLVSIVYLDLVIMMRY
jgi:hypothetical protein